MDAAELKQIPLFSHLSKKEIDLIARHADEVTLPAGSVIMREGDVAREVCVVLEGSVSVTQGGKHLKDLGPGEVVGEMGVVDAVHRNATVTALTEVRLVVMFGPEFTGVSDEIAAVRKGIAEIIAARRAE
jgi:CRP/FNR family cyclic AMP-dependent transcriptional regulator